jgi:hypothetical protein
MVAVTSGVPQGSVIGPRRLAGYYVDVDLLHASFSSSVTKLQTKD